jgi:hypothetical protein
VRELVAEERGLNKAILSDLFAVVSSPVLSDEGVTTGPRLRVKGRAGNSRVSCSDENWLGKV